MSLILEEGETSTFQVVAGYFGNGLALFFFFSPIVLFLDLFKGKITVDKIPQFMLFFNAMNCIMWTAYGLQIKEWQVWGCNGLGAVITTVWIILYIVYLLKLKPLHYIPANLVATYLIFTVFENLYWINTSSEITGNVAMAFNILMYAAPGQNIIQVYKTGNYNLIPLVSSIIGLCCSTSWLIFGLYISKMPIIIPNGLGVVFSIFTLISYFFFWRKNKDNPVFQKIIQNENEQTEF